MDISKLAKQITNTLVPLLPHLPQGEPGLAEAKQQMGQSTFQQVVAVWNKLAAHLRANPTAREAAEDFVAASQDEDALAALHLQVRKLLEQNQALAQELAQLVKPTEAGAEGGPGDMWDTVSDNVVASGAQSVAQRGERNYNFHFERATGMAIGDGAKVFNTQVGGNMWGHIVTTDSGTVTIDQSSVQNQLGELFESILEKIRARPEEPDVDKAEVTETVEKIRDEAAKGEEANPKKIERRLKFLAEMAPDIWDVVVETLKNPIAGVAEVVRKVVAKAKGSISCQ